MAPTWDAMVALFKRSHTFMLLEEYARSNAVPVGKKLDMALFSRTEEEFAHLCEVFEQDLRLGEGCAEAEFCSGRHESVLKAATIALLAREGKDPAGLLACKVFLPTDEEKLLADEWRN